RRPTRPRRTRAIATRRYRVSRWGSVAQRGEGPPRVGHRPSAAGGGGGGRAATRGGPAPRNPRPRTSGTGEGAADAGGEDDALEEGVGGEAVGAVDAGAGGFADGVEA